MVLGREGPIGQRPRHLGAIGGQDPPPHLDLPGRTLFIVGDPAEVDRFQQAATGAGRLQWRAALGQAVK